MSAPDLHGEFPELADWDLTEVDIVDDGEKLARIPAESQDFIIANHFLEHTEDPIGTIGTHLGKLKPGGVLFYAVPDKRFTFDFRRPVTPIERMVADFEQGPERSRSEHYREWCRLVIEEMPSVGSAAQATSEEWIEERAKQLEAQAYSIHMHVWTQAEFLNLILALRQPFDDAFDLEAAARVGIEFIVVLRKAGPLPSPPTPSPPNRSPRKCSRSADGRSAGDAQSCAGEGRSHSHPPAGDVRAPRNRSAGPGEDLRHPHPPGGLAERAHGAPLRGPRLPHPEGPRRRLL